VIQIETFSDVRLEGWCAYCGKMPDTRDHVPSRVLLDKPLPENLPVVASCKQCNEDFSLDEEYFACLLECAVCGTTEIEGLQREKIKKILSRKPKLRRRISEAVVEIDGQTFFKFEPERFKKVIMKLARGHARYENSELQLDEPSELWIKAVHTMTEDEIEEFFSERIPDLLPEFGSRSFQRIFIDLNNNAFSSWISVQPENYRYSFNCDGKIVIKILIREYLAVRVIWN
jgi:hypothetical protein